MPVCTRLNVIRLPIPAAPGAGEGGIIASPRECVLPLVAANEQVTSARMCRGLEDSGVQLAAISKCEMAHRHEHRILLPPTAYSSIHLRIAPQVGMQQSVNSDSRHRGTHVPLRAPHGGHVCCDLALKDRRAMPLPPGTARHSQGGVREAQRRSGTGKPAYLVLDDTPKKEEIYTVPGFNAILSDEISLNRCKTKKYVVKWSSVSVIVPFHNEHWSTLLRTVVSIINHSQSSLLVKVILVYDASTKEHSKKLLDEYVSKNLPKEKVIHLTERSELIHVCLAGYKQTAGEVLIFLDSHTEANANCPCLTYRGATTSFTKTGCLKQQRQGILQRRGQARSPYSLRRRQQETRRCPSYI
ncbi:hypothetical protein PR048_010015 [Dryococelus australis]|uniref:Glycosyltransferase 2-like domain-containing protein n=1 Tax=Dryococelus australis TaxID=614101 RepID=A0ABQ9I1I7_9NEOP|nr:hypothetical protein PR048_010015 [Dryococelus australis]